MHIVIILLFLILCALVPGLLGGLVMLGVSLVVLFGGGAILVAWFVTDPISVIVAGFAFAIACLLLSWLIDHQKRSALRAEERKQADRQAAQDARTRVATIERLRASSIARVGALRDLTVLRMRGQIVEHKLPNGTH